MLNKNGKSGQSCLRGNTVCHRWEGCLLWVCGLWPLLCWGRVPPSEKAMAPHSSTLAWKIPWTEEPGRLQSMRSLRVGHDWATSLSLFTFMHWRRQWQPTPVFLPGESQGQGSLVGCRLWGSHRVGHDWSDLAAAAAAGSLHACFLESFYHKSLFNFAKSFSWIYWDDQMAVTLQSVAMVSYADWFACIEEYLHPSWSWCMVL